MVATQFLPSAYRKIIDLADFTTARFIQTTGQSGHPLSKHYDDLMPLWRAVEYVPMDWGQAKVKAEARDAGAGTQITGCWTKYASAIFWQKRIAIAKLLKC